MSLRPLTDIERTAEAIGAGDLSQRVPDADASTEVGHLAGAINGMLGQIEASVQAREASEREARASERRMRQFLDDASHELERRSPPSAGSPSSIASRSTSPPTSGVGWSTGSSPRPPGWAACSRTCSCSPDSTRTGPSPPGPVDLVPLAADAAFDLHTLDPDRPVERAAPDG